MNAGLVVFQHRQFRLKHLKKITKKSRENGESSIYGNIGCSVSSLGIQN